MQDAAGSTLTSASWQEVKITLVSKRLHELHGKNVLTSIAI